MSLCWADQGTPLLGAGWLGWARQSLARPGKAWMVGWMVFGAVRLRATHSRRGMAVQTSARRGKGSLARLGLEQWRADGPRRGSTPRRPRSVWQGWSRLGGAWLGSAGHGAAEIGSVQLGMEFKEGQWHTSEFESPGPTHGRSLRGLAGRGLAAQRMAWPCMAPAGLGLDRRDLAREWSADGIHTWFESRARTQGQVEAGRDKALLGRPDQSWAGRGIAREGQAGRGMEAPTREMR